MRYWRNVGSMATRFLNALAGGNVWGESTSSAVGRKSLEGRIVFRIWEFSIDLLFLVATRGQQRRHCIQNIDWHLLPKEVRERTLSWAPPHTFTAP